MGWKAVQSAASTHVSTAGLDWLPFVLRDHSSRIIWVRFRDRSLLAIGKFEISEGGELNRSAFAGAANRGRSQARFVREDYERPRADVITHTGDNLFLR